MGRKESNQASKRGGQGVRTPLENHKLLYASTEILIQTPRGSIASRWRSIRPSVKNVNDFLKIIPRRNFLDQHMLSTRPVNWFRIHCWERGKRWLYFNFSNRYINFKITTAHWKSHLFNSVQFLWSVAIWHTIRNRLVFGDLCLFLLKFTSPFLFAFYRHNQ